MAVGLLLLVVVLGLRLAALIPSYGETPEPWKQVVGLVLADAQPRDCVAFYPFDGRQPFGYYVDTTPGASATAPPSVYPAQPWNVLAPHVEQYPVVSTEDLARRTRGCSRVWLISSHQGQRHGPPVSRQNYFGYQVTGAELSELFPDAKTNVYGWASTISVTLYQH